MENAMEFAGVINSEEMMSGLLHDGRRIFVPASMYEYASEEQRDDPEWWGCRLEFGDFEDDFNPPMVWTEGDAKMKIIVCLK